MFWKFSLLSFIFWHIRGTINCFMGICISEREKHIFINLLYFDELYMPKIFLDPEGGGGG